MIRRVFYPQYARKSAVDIYIEKLAVHGFNMDST
jgi:hypothetical protein